MTGMRAGVVTGVAAGLLVLAAAAALATAATAHRYLVVTADDNYEGRIELVRAGGVVRLLARGEPTWNAAWAADRSFLAWTGERTVVVARAEGSGKPRLRELVGDWFAWSPAGHRLVASGAGGGRRVVIVDAASGLSRDITPRGGRVAVLGWLPAGLILYSRNDPQDGRIKTLLVAREDGSDVRSLASIVADWDDWSLSPDGRNLLVCGPDRKRQVCTLSTIASGQRTRFTAPPGMVSMFWLPDRRVGFAALQPDGRVRLLALRRDGRGARTLIVLPRGERLAATMGVAKADASPDRTRLAFLVGSSGQGHVMTIGVDGRNRRTLHPGSVSDLEWLPDGTLALEIGRTLVETRDAANAPSRVVYRSRGSHTILSFAAG